MAALMSGPDANNSDPSRVVAKITPLDREPCLMGSDAPDGYTDTTRTPPRVMGSGQHVMGQP